MKNSKLHLMLAWSFLLPGAQAIAQDENSPAAVPPDTEDLLIPADSFDRGTPKQSADGFLLAIDDADYETAAEYMDLRNLRGEAMSLTGAQLARRFSVIVKRATWVDVDDLLDHPDGRGNDGLPDYRDSIGLVLDGDREVQLLMQKVPRGDGVYIWKISNATVSLIPKLYATYGYSEFIETLRRSLPSVTIAGFELFKWVVALAVGFAVYASVFLIAFLIRRLFGDSESPSHRRVFRFVLLPFGMWLVTVAMISVANALGRGGTAEVFQRWSPLPILVTVWVMFAAMNLIRELYSSVLLQRKRPGAAVLLQPATNALKILIAMVATLIYLDKIGVDITTVLAGLGVGGIAMALALQKPMEDVFGAITLYTQQPIRVGDFCRVGAHTGTIEEIGLRTTRLRTLADTLIAIPNARLANEPIDNISARKKILYRPTLRLRYDTTPQQLQHVLEGVRSMLGSHDKVLQDNHRVRFNEISDDALLIEVHAYLDTNVWAEYLEMAEDLNLQILEIVAQSGTSLSLPARAVHIEKSGDNDKTAKS